MSSPPKSLIWSAFLLATGLSSQALATRGEDDYGLWVVSLLFGLVLLAGASTIIHFSLRFWTRRNGLKEGRFWLTLLGSVLGGVIVVALVRLAPLDDGDMFRSSIPWPIQVALPIIGAVAGFFVLRRDPP